jgi:hypothetical protein
VGWTTSIQERNELIDDMIVDRALEEFFYEFCEPDVIFLCFFLIFLCPRYSCEGCGSFFALLFALFCDLA